MRHLPFVGEEVKKKLKMFLTLRLPQTGCLPIGKIVADKATNKHRTRHFICFITCVPDSDDLIQALFLEINIVKGHTGQALCQNILETMQRFGLSRENYNGGSYDGQYFHLNVPELLDNALGFKNNQRKH